NMDFRACIDACMNCALACDNCAAACLQEQDVKMLADCIRTDMECSTVCKAAVELMVQKSSFAKDLCRLCAQVCDRCAAECEKHEHGHCRQGAEACRRCAEECRKMAA